MDKMYTAPLCELIECEMEVFCADNTSKVDKTGYLQLDSVKDIMPD